MKIELKADGPEKEEVIILSDEHINNDLFVELVVGDKELVVNLNELTSALYAFQVKATKNERYED
jgi:hypothetical protein